jgi:beta-glucanase (GH16 family)
MMRLLLYFALAVCVSSCKNDDDAEPVIEPEIEKEPEQEKPMPTTGYTTPETYAGMSLVWHDEFDGTSLNLADWTFETGGNGWGNNELQYYQEKNTTVKDGYLTITAEKEFVVGKSYSSSRIITQGKKEFQYGRVDIRAVLPKGQGIWPALWMLGGNISTVGWPKCGEIDIMEMIGGPGKDNTVHGTVHWDHGGSHAMYGNSRTLANNAIFADEFHVFSIVWTPTTITWYLDDVQFNVIDTTPAELSEFQAKYFFIFNVAVGGNWPGEPNAATKFPQRMYVDYIRVFQNN